MCVCVCLTLHTLGQISQVEHIVGFSWSGKQIHAHAAVNLHCSIHYTACSLLHCCWEISEEATQDRL